MDVIKRDVFVRHNTQIKEPIRYVRATNTIPLEFDFRDFEIPQEATARAYVQKPSGKAVYDDVTITGNTVHIDVTTQMFAEVGKSLLQVQIIKDEKTLVTFAHPVLVEPNYTEGDAPQSKNEAGFFGEYKEELDKLVDAAGASERKASESAEAAKLSETKSASSATAAAGSAGNAAQSATESASSASAAAGSASEAKKSETAAASSASAAGKSATSAEGSATAAAGSAGKAAQSATESASSASAAAGSASEAKKSETAAASFASAAGKSATSAEGSATAAAGSAGKAAQSATESASSASAAAGSASEAKKSETAAASSASAAGKSATSAEGSATAAAGSAGNAAQSATESVSSASAAAGSAGEAKKSETAAANSASAAGKSATSAEGSATAAKTSETNAGNSAKLAESYAHGGTGARTEEDTDNAKEYARQAKDSADRAASAVGGDYIPNSEKGKSGGVATLDSNGRIPSGQHPAYTPKTSGLYKVTVDETGHISAVEAVSKKDITDLGIPEKDTNTTYEPMKGANTSSAGAAGLVPQPGTGANNRYLRSDGQWAVPPDTNTWTQMKGATANAAGGAGYVPAPPMAGYNTKYLRADGNWETPPDHDTKTYGGITGIGSLTAQTTVADTDNLLVGTDGAKKITFANLVTAIKNKLTGAVSTILTSNLTVSRVLVSDGNGKVSVSSITATVLGYLSGVTSAIQTQLSAKLDAAKVLNAFTATSAGYALDAMKGKELNDKITELNGKIYTDYGVRQILINGEASTYTSFSTAFTFPSDGQLICAKVSSGLDLSFHLHIIDKAGTDHMCTYNLGNNSYGRNIPCAFVVFKGQKVWFELTQNSNAYIVFDPFINY